MKIRRDDTVIIIAGRERGKKGKVRRVFPREDRVIVEGLNMAKRHSRARKAVRQAGIIDLEAPIHVSNVMLVCTKCEKPTRVGFHFLGDGKKVRVCHSCGEMID